MALVDARKAVMDFVEPLRQVWADFTGRELVLAGVERLDGKALSLNGVVALVSFSGRFRGRLLVNLSKSAAGRLHEAALGEPASSDEEVLLSCMELANMVGGGGLTALNDRYRGSNLRLAPPSAFAAEPVRLCNFGMNVFNVLLRDGEETIRLNLAMKEEDAS
jgi:CheY-specific phosphatase CheX